MDGCRSRKETPLFLRDTAKSRDQNGPVCSRPRCSSRLNPSNGKQNEFSEKAKSSRPLIHSSPIGKKIVGSSSRAYSAVHNSKISQKKTDLLESSSIQNNEVSELVLSEGNIQQPVHNKNRGVGSGRVMVMKAGGSSVASNISSSRNLNKKSKMGFKDGIKGSSDSLLSKTDGQPTSANSGRYGLRNFKGNSADVSSSGCSSSDSSLSRRKNPMKKINGEEGSSSARGKNMSVPCEGQSPSSSLGISRPDSRRAKNYPARKDNEVALVKTRRSNTSSSRGRLFNQVNGNKPPLVMPQISQPEMHDVKVSSPLDQFSAESSSSRRNSYSRPGSSSEILRSIMSSATTEFGLTRDLLNRDSFRHYNIDGITEALLALEMTEQGEELSDEQLAILETNFFLNGLDFDDQHRDMRLDIDNMSYEELLALGESMGSVSTALTEETFTKCITRSIYQPILPEDANFGCEDNHGVKCSVCQEEYDNGDEMGTLQCQHKYHVNCIKEWLHLKNWCPICKTPAAASP